MIPDKILSTMRKPLQCKIFQWYSPFRLKVIFQICRVLYKLEIRGAENIPAQGPFICVVNHASKLESILLLHLLRKMRSDSYIYGGGGPAWSPRSIKAMQMIPAPRGVGRSGPWLWMALKILREGSPIGIAPEGAVRWDGRLQPLQPGAAWLALRSGAPIIACVLRGGYSIWPRWARFPKLTGRLEIRIGKPFGILQNSRRRVDEEMIQAVNRRIVNEMSGLEGKGEV